MRPIKFRGMSINGDWHYGLLAHTENKNVCGEIGWFISNKGGSPFACMVRPETIGEYTGLKDKNGKEIYEGDVVELNAPWDGEDLTGVVEFQTCGCGYGFYANCRSKKYELQGAIEFMVIGNIYENKDLL